MHTFVPHPDPAWGDFCTVPNPDENNQPCGWTEADHKEGLMDPNEALRLIRAYIRQMRVEDRPVGNQNARLEFVQHARDLAETVEGLDKWLSSDGFLPADWQSDDEKSTRPPFNPTAGVRENY